MMGVEAKNSWREHETQQGKQGRSEQAKCDST